MIGRIGAILLGLAAVVLVSQLSLSSGLANTDPRPRIQITVTKSGTGEPIKHGETLDSISTFVVSVTTDRDCAGQFVVTAIGAPDAPPSVLVQWLPFVIGPSSASNTVSGEPLDSGLENDWKVSASCNGNAKNDFDFDSFEFFVDAEP